MNVVLYIFGGAIVLISIIILLNNWADDRSGLLDGTNGVLKSLLISIFAGLVLGASPMLIIPNITPTISFEFNDYTITDIVTERQRAITIELDGEFVDIGKANVRDEIRMPGCNTRIGYTLDYVVSHDKYENVTIAGKRCSELDSVIQLPQVVSILSGWRVTVDQLAIPTLQRF